MFLRFDSIGRQSARRRDCAVLNCQGSVSRSGCPISLCVVGSKYLNLLPFAQVATNVWKFSQAYSEVQGAARSSSKSGGSTCDSFGAQASSLRPSCMDAVTYQSPIDFVNPEQTPRQCSVVHTRAECPNLRASSSNPRGRVELCRHGSVIRKRLRYLQPLLP